MKKLHIAGNLLKGLLLAGMLTGCQNDDVLNPQLQESAFANEAGAKVNAELKLTKDGVTSLQYIKSGRFTGWISKVSETNYYTQYYYVDGGGNNFSVTSKRYQKSNNGLVEELQYNIVNGKCLSSIDKTSNINYEYNYSEVGRLNWIKSTANGSSSKRIFTYDYISATGVERLNILTFASNVTAANPNGITYKTIDYNYYKSGVGNIPDKYHLNPQFSELDRYLPIFGKFSDALITDLTAKLASDPSSLIPFYRFTYTLNSDGYPTFRTIEYFPGGAGNNNGKQTISGELKYSTSWAGL
ncbi:hypothetical protein [Dyadobacter beijingensis]|nr:hypothetical protein [Dyadobacter beijingensis]